RPITKVLKQRAAPRARLGLAHPGLLGEPFMLGPADRAVDAREEDRRGIETLAIGDETGGDVSSGLRTSHHDGTHWRPLLLLCCCVHPIRQACENHLTQPRQERGTHPIHRTRRFAAAGNPHRNFAGERNQPKAKALRSSAPMGRRGGIGMKLRLEAALWFHSRGFAADDDLTRMRLYEGACVPRCSISSSLPIALRCVLLHRGTRRGSWSCVRA